jgi:hypothetical protein
MESFEYFAEFSAAAYCRPNHSSEPGTLVKCSSALCPTLETNAATIFRNFEVGIRDIVGLVASDDATKSIVVSFRGTNSLQNWIANLDYKKVKINTWPECDNCKLHGGWWKSWKDVRKIVKKAVKELMDQHPDYRIVTTGHSLGGAIAQIAAADMRATEGIGVDAYTYGSPRIGNPEASEFITNQTLGRNYRVTHKHDIVTNFPPLFKNYRHVSPEYNFRDYNQKPEDFKVYEGGYNYGGATKKLGVGSPTHHRYYLVQGRMSSCSSFEAIPWFRLVGKENVKKLEKAGFSLKKPKKLEKGGSSEEEVLEKGDTSEEEELVKREEDDDEEWDLFDEDGPDMDLEYWDSFINSYMQQGDLYESYPDSGFWDLNWDTIGILPVESGIHDTPRLRSKVYGSESPPQP